MTLTTEQLRSIAEEELDACSTLDAAKLMARELLANREAQPVGWLYDGDKALPPMFVLGDNDPSEYWKVKYERVYTAPPAPACPEMLPCPVHLLPGLKFGKGAPTRSMLDALVRRAEYEYEREAMTPEQKAEDDARIEAFKALLPKSPAPAVPDDYQHLKNVQELYHKQEERLFVLAQHIKGASFDKYSHSTAQAIDVLERAIFGDDGNACRAAMLNHVGDANEKAAEKCECSSIDYCENCLRAMLAQPVSSGYKLVPIEPTSQVIAPFIKHCCENETWVRQAWREMLAAAPEVGNDHDTRR
ncbi:hypothetical protein ABCT86_002654 [Serratia marcescens]